MASAWRTLISAGAAGACLVAVSVAGPVAASARPASTTTPTLTLAMSASTVARPYLLVWANVKMSPAGTPYRLEIEQPGSNQWSVAPDLSGVWGLKPGWLHVRAISQLSGQTKQVVSASAAVRVAGGAVPRWLRELNRIRALNDAPAVAEDTSLSSADALHVRYMSKTGSCSYSENPDSPWYTKRGAKAGANSNLACFEADPIKAWATSPYDAEGELNKYGTLAGYSDNGEYAGLWIDPSTSVVTPSEPLYQFPAYNTSTSLLDYSGGAEPNPLATCPAAWRTHLKSSGSVGPPIIFGNQDQISRPTATVTMRGRAVRVCVVNGGYAVFIIPLYSLAAHRTYTVTVSYRGKVESRWHFRTS